MVVDCGGGTVDITVYEMESSYGCLKELHKATGGPYGSVGKTQFCLINIDESINLWLTGRVVK